MSTTYTTELDDLAHLIARDGITAYEPEITRLVGHLRVAGHCRLLTDLLGDRGAPAVARERALGTLLLRTSVRSDNVPARTDKAA